MKRMLLILALCVVTASCGKKPPSPLMYTPAEKYSEKRAESIAEQPEIRQVVSEATIKIQAPEIDTVRARMIAMSQRFEGYVLKSDKNTISVRIPSIHFVEAITEIEALGKVLDIDISGQDVTDEFKDITIRLDNAEKTRQRYLAMLDMAKNIDEVLRLERELERLNKEIDLLKGRLERMAHLVEFSTLTVESLQEKRLGPLANVFNKGFQGMRWLFVKK